MAVDSGSAWAAAISAPQSRARLRAHEIAAAQVVPWDLSGEAAQERHFSARTRAAGRYFLPSRVAHEAQNSRDDAPTRTAPRAR